MEMIRLGRIVSFSLFVLCLLAPNLALSATIHVPKDYHTIQLAIDAAANGDTILVEGGTYIPNINFKGKAIILTSIRGPEVTVIDGNSYKNAVTFFSQEGKDSVINGFTITNSKSNGIYCNNNSSPTITNNIITANAAAGIYCVGASSPTIKDNTIFMNLGEGIRYSGSCSSSISENIITENMGAGIYCASSPSFLMVTNNTILKNKGAGIHCKFSSSPTITNNILSWNSGSGISCSNSSSPTITNNAISRNSAGYYGGGISCYYDCSPIITDNTIIGNSVGHYGGGICCTWSCFPKIMNNTISENRTTSTSGPDGGGGGGICCMEYSSPEIISNTIFNNTSTHDGGGIFCSYFSSPAITYNTISKNRSIGDGPGVCCVSSSSPTIMNNTISKNSTIHGGGGLSFKSLSSPNIMNNTISENLAYFGGGIFGVGASSSIANNLISHNITNSHGGGVYCIKTSSTITNNVINGNKTLYGDGAGIYCWNASPNITNNSITGNTASCSNGGGIFFGSFSTASLMNNTISGNLANFGGGGFCDMGSSPIISNSILWDNHANLGREIYIGETFNPSSLFISFSVVKGGRFSVHVEPNSILNWGQGMMDKDPLFVPGPLGFLYLSQLAAGQPIDSPCVDTGNDLASNIGMDLYWTRTDGVTDSGMVDIGFHYGNFIFPSLQVNAYRLSAISGGVINFLLFGEGINANRDYLILGGLSGTSPGASLPGNNATLPLNWDIFTNIVMANINTPVFKSFMGTLNSAGSGAADLDTLGPINPGVVGVSMFFAFALNNPWDFVSNPVEIKIAP